MLRHYCRIQYSRHCIVFEFQSFWKSCIELCLPSRHTTSYDVDIRLDLGRDVRWPKFNVKPTSNDNVKLTSKTDVSWRWYLVVFRLCCKVTKIQRRTNVSSQRHIDVKYWYLVVRYGNQNPTSARRHNGNVNTTSNSNIIWRWSLVSFRLWH